MKRILFTTLTLLLCAAPVQAQTFGSTTPDNSLAPFGRDAGMDPVFGAIAQTFVTPVGAPVLQSFTFFLGDFIGGANLQVQASVYEFTTDRIVGAALYTSSVRTGSSNAFDFDAYTFVGVNLTLAPATTYAFIFRTTALSPDGATNLVGTTGGDTFSLGQLFTSTGSTDAQLGTTGAFSASSVDSYGADAALTATFGSATTVPEPSTTALLSAGLVLLLYGARRRRTSAPI